MEREIAGRGVYMYVQLPSCNVHVTDGVCSDKESGRESKQTTSGLFA